MEEWNEIRRTVRELPEVDRTFVESMIRFSNVKATSELRQVLKTTSFLNEDEPYNRDKHYDAEWAELVMRKFLTDYEDPKESLQKKKESSSKAVSNRKNWKRVRTRHKKVGRKKMGYRMDGIFRMYVDNMEQLKWLRNSKKPSCLLMGTN